MVGSAKNSAFGLTPSQPPFHTKLTCANQTCFLWRDIEKTWRVSSSGIWRPPKRRLLHNRLHGVISQKKILFITTAVKTSNPTLRKHACELSYLDSNSVNRIYKGIVHGKWFHSTLCDSSLNIFWFGVHLKDGHRSLF
jgi:hypothetical protein